MNIPKTLRQLCLFLTLSCICSSVLAQFSRKSFGDFDKSWLNKTVYEPDSEAVAVYLKDWGKSEIAVNAKNASVIHAVHFQIKILSEAGLEYANRQLVYSPKGAGQTISKIKAVTYNLGEDGEIVETELAKKDIYQEEISDGVFVKKIAFPQARVGSVIEMQYVVKEDGIDIPTWQFQSSVPILHSEYITRIPNWYVFVTLQKGLRRIEDVTKESYQSNIRVGSGSMSVQGEETRYVIKDVPALVREPYITTMDDYFISLKFQLSATNYPGDIYKPVLSTWDKFTEELLDDSDFMAAIRRKGLMEDWLGIDTLAKDLDTRAKQVYQIVQQNVNYNNRLRYYTHRPIKEALAGQPITSGQVNMILVGALKIAGFESHPVLISSRSHGATQSQYPIWSQFNHVLCLVKLGENYIFLDGTHKYLPFGMLPDYSLNKTGFLLMADNPQWVDIQPLHAQIRKVNGSMEISPDGEITGSISLNCSQADGADIREAYEGHEGTDIAFAQDQIFGENEEITFNTIDITNKDLASPMVIRGEIVCTDYVDMIGDYIYLNPMLGQGFEENPFQLKERAYPVELARPIQLEASMSFKIPDGYELESVPEPVKMVVPSKGAAFIYRAQSTGPFIQVMYRFSIKQLEFQPGEYVALRALFDESVAKHAEQIVLRKKKS